MTIGPRYECREETAGTWCVYDTLTGGIAAIGGQRFDGLPKRDAVEFTALLNATLVDAAACARKEGPANFFELAE